MKLNIVDKGHSNVMNGADIPHGTVFSSVRYEGKAGLYVKYCYDAAGNDPTITTIKAHVFIDGHVYKSPEKLNFPDYKVVEELTAVVK